MTDEILRLIEEYGNASFDCGEWDLDDNRPPYEVALAKQQAAKKALIDALVPKDEGGEADIMKIKERLEKAEGVLASYVGCTNDERAVAYFAEQEKK